MLSFRPPVNLFYVSTVENWEKTLNPPDIYCYDVRLDEGGDIVRGIPEVGLEAIRQRANE